MSLRKCSIIAKVMLSNHVMWKIKSFQRLTDLKKSYNVRISTRSFVTVKICNNPSCDCNDFKKNNEKVFCKHILFLVIIVLNGEDLEEQLIKKFLSEDNLKVLFGSEMPANFLHQKSKRTNNIDIKTILATHPLHQQEQKWLFHNKTVRFANCASRSCQKRLSVGIYCFSVDGVLTMRINKTKAAPQNFISAVITIDV